MFQIHLGPGGEVVLSGRLDATQCDAALQFLNELPEPRIIDLAAARVHRQRGAARAAAHAEAGQGGGRPGSC